MSTSAHGVLAFVLGLAGGLLVTLVVASVAPMALWTSQAQAPSFYPTPTVGGPSGVPMYGKKNSYNVKVEIGEGENPDNAIRRFNRMFRNAGILQELRRRQQFENTQDLHKRRLREKGLRKIGDKFPPMTMAQYLEGRRLNFRTGRPMEDMN
eukprot:TRINITY_DN2515_c0_g1_i1.p2 TRINITY_DN2515_c0_g1~~TRINITY_DN2515_c0_g1_i1.p2  ORF type:complete len:159 (+),score=61.06 TRINITY_DN2515_c0_g1_i1:23-478(+)